MKHILFHYLDPSNRERREKERKEKEKRDLFGIKDGRDSKPTRCEYQ